MTKDDIMKMARDAGAPNPMVFFGAYERFAALVAAAEREACAQICDGYAEANHANYSDSCAEDIRARGNA